MSPARDEPGRAPGGRSEHGGVPPDREEPGGAELERLRAAIETVDSEIVRLLARRAALALEAARVKRSAGLPTLDPAREAGVVRRSAALARDEGLPDDPVRGIFWQVIELCRRVQTDAEVE